MAKTQKWLKAEPSTQSPFQKKNLILVVKNYQKADIKVSHPVQFSLVSWQFYWFCPRLLPLRRGPESTLCFKKYSVPSFSEKIKNSGHNPYGWGNKKQWDTTKVSLWRIQFWENLWIGAQNFLISFNRCIWFTFYLVF